MHVIFQFNELETLWSKLINFTWYWEMCSYGIHPVIRNVIEGIKAKFQLEILQILR